MIAFSEIEKQYPENLRIFKRFILREYLQYKLLKIIFESEQASKFCFLGGTCLRIVHGNNRFSEDLDFDNFGITTSDFGQLSAYIQNALSKEGYRVEMKEVYKNAYHCYVRFPDLLFNEGMSVYREEKILIQLDTEPQHFDFEPDTAFLNRFDIFMPIKTTPLDLLLAQKFYAILNRSRNKGRDFFDVVFLLSKGIKPNYGYLATKINIQNADELKKAILQHCTTISMTEMAKDVQPFLFDANDSKKVEYFPLFFQQAQL